MKLKMSVSARLLVSCSVLLFATQGAHGAPILYTFTATTQPTLGSLPHLEKFQLTVPDFLPLF